MPATCLSQPSLLFSFEEPALATVLPFWRALRELESRQAPRAYHDQMQRPIPVATLERLTALVSAHQRV